MIYFVSCINDILCINENNLYRVLTMIISCINDLSCINDVYHVSTIYFVSCINDLSCINNVNNVNLYCVLTIVICIVY